MSTPLRPSVIRGGRVIDPSQGFDGIADVVLIDGSVASVEATKVDGPAPASGWSSTRPAKSCVQVSLTSTRI